VTGIGPLGVAVAANIKRLRKQKRLTYTELSVRLSAAGRPIAVLGLRRIERLERRIDVDDLAALAAVLRVTIEDLGVATPACPTCDGRPPGGFSCLSCGVEG
jgi:transcriptional regulator with XRE-family HTH domain